jgi:tRNA U55 pseudouridine synthase TruB
MAALERTAVGGFHASRAIGLDDLDRLWSRHLMSPTRLVETLPWVEVTQEEARALSHGRSIAKGERRTTAAAWGASLESSELAALDSANNLVAILQERVPGELKPVRNFALPE